MLRPQDSATRERKALNGLWQFVLDPEGRGRSARWFGAPLADAREMAVPASFNDIAADTAVRDYFGDVWYQTTVRVPRGWDGRRVVLHFESATHRATVWVNDTEVVSHEGGYTPFEADVTEHVAAGEQARITVVVNNTLTFQSIPPGVVEDTPAGKRQRYWHDFFNYAGIHRTVWLYSTAAAHVADVTVVTGLDGGNGIIEYAVEVQGADGADVRVVLADAGGRTKVTGPRTGPMGRTAVSTARTNCSPGSPTRSSPRTVWTRSPTARTPTTPAGRTGPVPARPPHTGCCDRSPTPGWTRPRYAASPVPSHCRVPTSRPLRAWHRASRTSRT